MKIALMVVILSLLISNGFTASKNKGETGLSFLKIGVDARAVGMGEAYTAVSEDASAVYWNPAGLVGARHSNVLFNHNEWIVDIRGEFASLSLVRKSSAWGFHLRSLNVGNIEARADVPVEDPLETISAHYLSAGISYARRVSRNLNAGLTVKYLFEKIYVESATGFAVDFGITYRTPFQNAKIGAVLQNLGKMGKFKNEETALPVICRLGFLYNLSLKTESVTALLTADVVKPSAENVRFHLGTEVLVWNQIALRGGYLFGYEARNFALGLGFVRSAIRLDYGITPFWDDLGTTHRFSVNFIL
jgi:hypothetical protein